MAQGDRIVPERLTDMNNVRLESLREEALRPYETVRSVVRLSINGQWYFGTLKSFGDIDDDVIRVRIAPRFRYKVVKATDPREPGEVLVSKNNGVIIERMSEDLQPFILRYPRQIVADTPLPVLALQSADGKVWTALVSSRKGDLEALDHYLNLSSLGQHAQTSQKEQ